MMPICGTCCTKIALMVFTTSATLRNNAATAITVSTTPTPSAMVCAQCSVGSCISVKRTRMPCFSNLLETASATSRARPSEKSATVMPICVTVRLPVMRFRPASVT